jgi:hypothetical protein
MRGRDSEEGKGEVEGGVGERVGPTARRWNGIGRIKQESTIPRVRWHIDEINDAEIHALEHTSSMGMIQSSVTAQSLSLKTSARVINCEVVVALGHIEQHSCTHPATNPCAEKKMQFRKYPRFYCDSQDQQAHFLLLLLNFFENGEESHFFVLAGLSFEVQRDTKEYKQAAKVGEFRLNVTERIR